MKSFNFNALCIFLIWLVLIPNPLSAKDKTLVIQVDSGRAVVTLLEGTATRIKRGTTEVQAISQGDFLFEGDRIETGKDSKIELKLPDGSYIRYAESTTFELVSAAYDAPKKQRRINISMILGKTWAKVSRFFGQRGRFSVTTRTAVAGVRGTVYRLNVNEDNSVVVKVYWGEVVVNSQRRAEETVQPGKMEQPTKVEGPRPIPGPHPVTMEEWTYIVKSLQQINIRPDGTVTKPFRFDIKKDLNDWVLWNQQRDTAIGDI
ncbi:FecR domain-containing protein, partial [Thermodesulfobacteriota bacterium]